MQAWYTNFGTKQVGNKVNFSITVSQKLWKSISRVPEGTIPE